MTRNAMLFGVVLSFCVHRVVSADTIFVDDDATNDPGPGDTSISDPAEDGTFDHPFDAIQEAIDVSVGGDEVIVGDEVVVADGTYAGPGNKDLDFGGRLITLRSAGGPDLCFIDCEGDGRGVHFHSGETDQAVLEGFTIRSGSVTGNGGGILCESSSPTIRDCVLESNEVFGGDISAEVGCEADTSIITGWGGGLYCHLSDAVVTGCRFTGNTAYGSTAAVTGGGGGIALVGGCAELTDCLITGNEAVGTVENTGHGGGIFIADQSNATLVGCTITANTAPGAKGVLGSGFGAGIMVTCSQPWLQDCMINENTASGSGGGMWGALDSNLTLVNCTFTGNTAGSGGGMFGSGGGLTCALDSDLTLVNCTFISNTAESQDGGGGGVAISGSNALIIGSLFAGNVASGNEGGAIMYSTNTLAQPSSATIVNCTVVYNGALGGPGGGICGFGPGSEACVINSIVYDNYAFVPKGEVPEDEQQIVDLGVPPAQTTVLSSDVEGGWTNLGGEEVGDGNIDADPMFVDPDGPDNDPATYEDNDYRLAPGSPCIDTADNTALPPGESVDLDGNPRVVNCVVDMGAYEFQDTITITGDVNCDGTVNVTDLLSLFAAWGPCDYYRPQDINGDGTVNTIDLLTLLANWS